MEVQEVVEADGRSASRLGQLRGTAPDLHLDARGDEQLDDPLARVLGDRALTHGTLKRVRAGFVVGTHSHEEIRSPQLDVPAIGALGADAGHGLPIGRGLGALNGQSGPLGLAREGLPSCAVTITFAHRGARLEAPENTLEAFRLGLEQGASGLETDAHLSLDGEVVLVHDASVRRGIRRRRVAEASAAELAELGVPRLVDLYHSLGTDFELSVDLKVPDVAERLVALARDVGAAGRAWLCHPDLGLVVELCRRHPDIHVVHSTRRRTIEATLERHAAVLAASGVDALNLHHTEWTPGLVALFQRFGVRAFAWDVQEVRHLREMVAAGVDAIYCDRVSRMVTVIEELGSSDSSDES